MNDESKEWAMQDWLRMYKSLTDPDEVAKNKRKTDKEKIIEEKKKDYGFE